MLTIIICLLFGTSVGLTLGLSGASGVGWSIGWGVVTVLGSQAAAGLLLRRRVQKLMANVQSTLAAGQKRLQHKVAQWQTRPPGSLKQAQLELERDQKVFLEQALAQTLDFEAYHLWSPLLSRQTNTLRMQLYYQLHDFTAVDRLLPKCLFLEPMTAAMKLARMHMRKDPEMDRFFEKQVKRLRYGQGAILYALEAWSLIQRNDAEKAHRVLIKACEKMENETIKRNRDLLANNRVRQFSNSGLGDEWYALGLEEPKVKMQRSRGPGGRPF